MKTIENIDMKMLWDFCKYIRTTSFSGSLFYGRYCEVFGLIHTRSSWNKYRELDKWYLDKENQNVILAIVFENPEQITGNREELTKFLTENSKEFKKKVIPDLNISEGLFGDPDCLDAQILSWSQT